MVRGVLETALIICSILLIALADATSSVFISAINFDAPGDDHSNLNGEWVKITNSGSVPVDMTGWTLSDEGGVHVYQFPPFSLYQGQSVTVFTGGGRNSATKLYMGRLQAIWNNDWDCATLIDSHGDIIHRHCSDVYLPEMDITHERFSMLFDYNSSNEGNISAIEVTPCGRVMAPYHSHYANINVGRAGLFERTSALGGSYNSEEVNHFETEIMPLADVTIGNLTIRFALALSMWSADRSIEYAGKGISDRDYASNSFENITTHFLYNNEFSKNRTFTSPMRYDLDTHTTGIADLRYRQITDKKIEIDEQTYYGEYNLTWKKGISLDIDGIWAETDEDWLSCCFGGYYDIDLEDRKWNESRVFDCTYFESIPARRE